ncbi:MAG: hypothetical protein QOE44_2610, partial [Solirubrobacteraceae bacterium]|nr:hypothetical protein [Solirubrobacteraceae bacterium]
MRWRWWSGRAGPGGSKPRPTRTSIGSGWRPGAPPDEDSAPAFIGRRAEQEVFNELLAPAPAPRSSFVHLTGTPRSGRQALLEQFKVLADQAGARCGPVVDFEKDAGLELDELLDRVARGLEPEPEPEHFRHFFEAMTRFHSRESGQPSRTSQAVAVVRAGSSAVSQLAGALPVTLPFKAVDAAIQGPLGDVLTERAETRRTLSAVSDEFVTGLLALARARGPVVLLFSDLDFAPANAKVLWLRRSLLPRIAEDRVIVAASTQPQFDLEDVGGLFGRLTKMHLDRFSQDEAEEFLEQRIGLKPGSPLARAVLEDTNRFPERLAGYARYFDEHPEARKDERLPAAARDLTAGGFVSGLLARVPEPFLREVLLHAAPLRWFNAELLAGIETVAGLTAPPDGPHAAAVLEAGMRPSWVTNVGGGWGIDDHTRRRAIVDEFRRLHPGLYRQVHAHAARYHLMRLRELEDGPAPPVDTGAAGEVDVFAYQPITHPTDRLRWDEYLGSLGEWLYHLVALSPRAGFARLADYVGEALAWGYPAAAIGLLDIGVEITLPASEALARQRLLEVARALQSDRHAETLQLLAEFSAGGSASTIADAAARYLVGTRLVRLGRSTLTVHQKFEQAERLLAGTDGGVQTGSLRCLNLTRLASERARSDPRGEAALGLLDQAAALARTLDPRVQAEIERTRGLVLAGAGRPDEALAACDAALDLLGRVGAAADAALVLCLRADLNFRAAAGHDAAREDLIRARSIYRQLVDPEAEAQVLVGLLEIAVTEGDDRGATELEAAVAGLRPSDFLVRNQIGSLYYHAGRHEQAVARYTEAVEMAGEAGEPALFASRGRARLRWAAQLEPGKDPPVPPTPGGGPAPEAMPRPEDLRRQAREDLAAAYERDPDDLDVGIELAELERRLGDSTAAVAAALSVAERIVAAGSAFPPPPPPAPEDPGADRVERNAITRRLRDLLVRAVTLLGPVPARQVLDGWMASQPADEELELMRAIAGHELSDTDRAALDEAILAAGRAAGEDDPPRGRALVELAVLEAQARHWPQAKAAAKRAARDETVRVQAEYLLDRLDQMHKREDEFGGQPETVADELIVYIAESLLPSFDPNSEVGSEFFGWMIDAFHRRRHERLGVAAPRLLVDVGRELPPGWVEVVLDGVSRARIPIQGDLLAAA